MGPARTGPAFHVDPYLTPAWNAVVWGRKRWYYEAPRPIKWYKKYYERLSSAQRPLEVMHGTGAYTSSSEVMFLPAGWWHQVINTEDTLAVTQNYVNRHCLKMKDKSFNKTFQRQILDKHPELWDIVKGRN
ncbi:hypothetical protein DAPPUDRAFT_279308 [Daphnia pulex]|uniref:JmjC domain-containing protein n=1 Tax=Daphnia pulex TaxID=6669 RepID=E9I7B1_DAPPU|nr:hypothetical protein DAPPUDRAFT_279308 [Daphnia pulex]|eukprot:EFX60119.1 hypothetical protein DAPPUDRAFT_279308 [Daphnia pulex]